MQEMIIKEHHSSSIVKLTNIALVIWLISLLLTGFSISSNNNTYTGGFILLFGLLFGWMANGWAVYANLCFLRVVSSLIANKHPQGSVILMILLAGTLPFFPGPPMSEANDTAVPVTSWGWGAVFWLVSLVLVSIAAALKSKWMSKNVAQVCVFNVFISIFVVYGIRCYQFSIANDQDREAYLSTDVAFTVAPLCAVPLTWPDKALLSPDEIIIADIDPQLQSSDHKPYLNLPALPNYRENGYNRVTFGSPFNLNKVHYPAEKKHPVLQAKATSEGAIIRLLDVSATKVLYEQRLIIQKRAKNLEYCPRPSGFTKKGYDTAILKVLGHERTELQ
jgi:hypothetical protein